MGSERAKVEHGTRLDARAEWASAPSTQPSAQRRRSSAVPIMNSWLHAVDEKGPASALGRPVCIHVAFAIGADGTYV